MEKQIAELILVKKKGYSTSIHSSGIRYMSMEIPLEIYRNPTHIKIGKVIVPCQMRVIEQTASEETITYNPCFLCHLQLLPSDKDY